MQKFLNIGLAVAIVVLAVIVIAKPATVEKTVVEKEKVGAIPGTMLPEEGSFGARGYKNVKQQWGTTGVICQIPVAITGTSTLKGFGVLGASSVNTAGNLQVFKATTTYDGTTGFNATTSGVLLFSNAVLDGTTFQDTATSVGDTLLDQSAQRFLTQGDVLIFDYTSATTSIGINHLRSTCTAESQEL